MNKFLLLLILLGASFHIMGQTTPKAIKFDELSSLEKYSYEESNRIVKERIDRFVGTAIKQRGKIAYFIHYRARVREGQSFWNRSSEWATQAKYAVAAIDRVLESENVLVIDGGVRNAESLEFWFVPKNAEPPRPTPTFDRSEAIDCPSIYAYQDGIQFDRKNPIYFKASSYPTGAYAYKWTVTDGKIIGENGISFLRADVSDVKADRVTAFVEIEGLPLPCKNTAFAIAEFSNTPRLIDEFGRVANGDIKARLDAFFVTLQNHPEKQGYAYIYGGRDMGSRDSQARRQLLSNQILFRRFDASRIKIIDAGYREEISTEYWLVPSGVDAPKPTPTVDKYFVAPARRVLPARKRSN